MRSKSSPIARIPISPSDQPEHLMTVTHVRRALRAATFAALVAAVPHLSAFAQNEEAQGSSSKAAQHTPAPRTIPAERQANTVPTTIVTNAARAVKVGGVPLFQVDPFWPKPLPNNWILGPVSGVAVDKRDHLWIIHR